MRSRYGPCLILLLAVLVVVACAGGGRSSSSSTATPVRVPHLEVAGPQPSTSAKMVCAAEGQHEIAASIGDEPTRPVVGRWHDHIYSCDYTYRAGQTMTLSVKQLSSTTETTGDFDALGVRLGRGTALQGLGQGAYRTTNGSTVVRKDYLVLLVDVTHLAAQFGVPSSPRADISLSVAATIMGCWTGA